MKIVLIIVVSEIVIAISALYIDTRIEEERYAQRHSEQAAE